MDDDAWSFPRFSEHVDYDFVSRAYGVGAPGGIRVVEYDVVRPGSFGVHIDREVHQLSWLDGAELAVFTGDDVITVPSAQAIWIPSGTVHDIAAAGPGRLFCAYFLKDDETLDVREPTLLTMDETSRGLLRYLAGDLEQGAGIRARDVLLDALRMRIAGPAALPMPVDPRARAVAEAVLRDPAHGESLWALATAMGASTRTIRRKFLEETGMSFRDWSARARMNAALPLLASARSVEHIAGEVGYASGSAFIVAFRSRYGQTPDQYRRLSQAKGSPEGKEKV